MNGAVIFVQDAVTSESKVLAYNNELTGNYASGNGGVVANIDGEIVLLNNAISGNLADGQGGAVFADNVNLGLVNNILWGNSSEIHAVGGILTIEDNIIQGGYAGTNILDVDPQFMQMPDYTLAPHLDGDVTIASTSPAIDKGNNAAIQYVKSVPYISCLLYTSPSPRDRTRSRMPSSA